jgi:hypothetical protein
LKCDLLKKRRSVLKFWLWGYIRSEISQAPSCKRRLPACFLMGKAKTVNAADEFAMASPLL